MAQIDTIRPKYSKLLPYVAVNAGQAAAVSAPSAITSSAPSAGYVQAEATAVRTDVVNLRATVNAIYTALAAQGLV